MNKHVTDVIGSTQSGIWMDKRFLNQLTEEDWKETILELQKSLTDSIIEIALHKFPGEIYNLSADFIGKRLRSRRDEMMRFGMRYYHILNKQVDITASDKNEIFTIDKRPDYSTGITIQDAAKQNQPGDTIFHRVFDSRITKQINLYGFGGDDVFNYKGNTNNKTCIRSFGNEGHDSFINKNENALQLKNTSIYDMAGDASQNMQGLNYHITGDTAVSNYHWDAFKYDWWLPIINPGYNPDDGFIIGAGITYKKQRWNKHPFGWQQTFVGNYAASTGAFNLIYRGTFTHAVGNWDLGLKADYKAPSFIVNFYGFGNNTKLDQDKKSFYRARVRSIFVNPQISRQWLNNKFATGFVFNSVKVENNSNKFISQPVPGIDSSIFTTKYFGGLNLLYSLNTADSLRYPTRGVDFHAGAEYTVNLQHGSRDYVKLHSSFTFYYTPFHNITIAHRTGAALNAGQYEFYQANALGGFENMRGYWRSRFTGKGNFYQNTDIRVKLGKLKGYILRGDIGIYGFFDDGRVWVKDDHSNDLHTGYGGGLYFLPFDALAINIYYASSKEINTFTIRTGFLF